MNKKLHFATQTSSSGISLSPMWTSAPVLFITNTLFTDGLISTAASTVFFSSIFLLPLSAWSAVITVSQCAVGAKSL